MKIVILIMISIWDGLLTQIVFVLKQIIHFIFSIPLERQECLKGLLGIRVELLLDFRSQ